MRYRRPGLLLLLLPVTAIVFVALLASFDDSVISQTRDKNQTSNDAGSTPAPSPGAEVVKVDIDLVTVDALVLQKKTARMVGGLKKEQFAIYEDGTRQGSHTLVRAAYRSPCYSSSIAANASIHTKTSCIAPHVKPLSASNLSTKSQ